MSFNKRFLSENSIRSFAKADSFKSFERYMTYADAYITETGWASEIYHKFGEAEESERKNIHQSIINNLI
jgi:hypothetical protein